MTDGTAIARADWDTKSESYQRHHGPYMAEQPYAWGTWRIPEDDLHALGEVEGRRAVEIGCGAGHMLHALARRGAHGAGVDLSAAQLAHARRNFAHGVELVLGDAAVLPFADASFDIAYSDHGGIGWADPRLAIPEAARVLRPGGRLAFCRGTPLHDMCWDDDEDRLDGRLHKPHQDARVNTERSGARTYHLSHGEMVRVLVRSGFEVLDLMELCPTTPDAVTSWPWLAPEDWSRNWPVDEIWVAARK